MLLKQEQATNRCVQQFHDPMEVRVQCSACALQVKELVREIIPTRPSRLSFSQLQNVIADIAIERNYTYYFWGHSDVAVMASNATAVHSAEVLRSAPGCTQSPGNHACYAVHSIEVCNRQLCGETRMCMQVHGEYHVSRAIMGTGLFRS